MAVANLLRRRCCTSLPFATVVLVLGFCSSHVSLALAAARSKVEYLPGFGPLPFELETGYIGIGESEDVQLFYYFVKSESNHNVDPIMLWISGGPGCSSLFALTQELGPLLFDLPKNNGALPTLSLNPYSWTKWLADHLEYQSNSFYVGGDSFSGVTVPMVVNAISYGINIGLNPHIDLKGYFVGNAFTYPIGYIIQMTRGLDLIPDEIYKSYQECGGNLICLLNFLKIGQLTLVNFPQNILETNCFGRNEIGASYGQSSVAKRFRGFNVHALDPFFLCKGQELISLWANDDSVQEALHIRKGSIEKWVQCRDDLPFNRTVLDSRPYYAILSMKGYRSLIYSGDHDLFVCSLSTEAWTKSLGYSIIDDWRPWFMNNQIVGYTRTFSNNMTYAKIKGSGHIAPVYTPLECFIMFKRWISYEKL
ncbi:PREDICTED: serine carboxypeptidase-like 11 isoform X2 [Ipomoea nil]|uniref:serine carboxypeptidase-like 11 isoform X2 n=1 Tax=Ipomoea nil TaxID=35883 RepID=UPI000901739A|nr:PREDICTED: serine carboxypeptidase-like 11 isoform X2 [Ipomoea nil]